MKKNEAKENAYIIKKIGAQKRKKELKMQRKKIKKKKI